MKKYVYALAAFLAMGFASCSKDNDNDGDNGGNNGPSITEDVIYAFTNENATMFNTASAEISLSRNNGYAFTTPIDLEFEVEVDAASTAEEDVHFSFAGDKKVVIPSGSSKASLKLNFLTKEDGKDVIVLKLKQKSGEHFKMGMNETLSIVVVGSAIEPLKGTWSSCVWYDEESWRGFDMDDSVFPVVSPDDRITISDDGFDIESTSDLKNYFAGHSSMKYINQKQFHPGMSWPGMEASVFVLDNINAPYSANKTDIKPSRVAFTVEQDEDGEDVLWVFVYSYEPIEFLMSYYELGQDYATEEDPAMYGCELSYTFKRVK
ncbi:MAG: hypothetical protein J1E02_00905 [Coprobacter sp.]|nr:hypothetical protein [Coprobacter sp.]